MRRLTNAEYINAVEALFDPVVLDIPKTALPSAVDVDGFDNNIDLSAAYPSVVESYRLLGGDVSARVWRELPTASGCEQSDAPCVRDWLGRLADRVAWRTDVRSTLLSAFDEWQDADGLEQATRLSLQLLLLSPDFTYAPLTGNRASTEGVPLGGRELARRMAFFLWSGPSDDELVEAADRGDLESEAGVRAQAARLLQHPRARVGVLRFYEQLLEWDRVAAANLDPDAYLIESPHIANDEVIPRTEEFTGEYLRFRLQPAIRAESELFVEHHLFDGKGTLGALLTETESYGTWDLAELVYGIDIDDSGPAVLTLYGPVEGLEYPMYPMTHDASERAGLLTFAAFLHSHAGPLQPSPVRRGAFVLDRLLCAPAPPPPDDIPPLVESTGGDPITNRERYAEHTNNPACQDCHQEMDSIGFTFEGFDSLGAVRLQDAGYPVDTSGALFGTDVDKPLVDALDLAHTLASSRTVHDCHVRQWFRYAFGRRRATQDVEMLDDLNERFWQSEGNVKELLLDIVTSDSFKKWRPEP